MADHTRDVVLVNPPYERIAPGFGFVRHVANRSPSLGLLHLAAVLRQEGFRPTLIEGDLFDLDEDAIVRQVVASTPAFVGFTLFTVGVAAAARIATRVKAALPQTHVLVGGPHVASLGRETLARYPAFDIAVPGEGEPVIAGLLDALAHGRPLADVPGILFRDGGAIRAGPPAPSAVLDELPWPAWDLLPGFPERYPLAVFDYPEGPVATLAASRGCPFHCQFCDTALFGARVRAYSPETVYGMMAHLHQRWGVRHVQFIDDLFVASRSRVSALCRRLIDHPMPVTWSCNARVDTVRPDLLALMRQAGCWQISFGLETGSDALLKRMDKKADLAGAERAVGWADAAGIRVKGLFMLGYPGEDGETTAATRAYVGRLPLSVLNLSKFTPYPGSPIYRTLFGAAIRDDHWPSMNGMNFLFAPDGLTIAELDRHYRQILVRFYRRPRVLARYLAMSLRHPRHLGRVLRFLAAWIAARVGQGRGKRRPGPVRPLADSRQAALVLGPERNALAHPVPVKEKGLPQAL